MKNNENTVKITISENNNFFEIKCSGILNDVEIKSLSSMAGVYTIVEMVYRLAQKNKQTLEVKDLYSTLKITNIYQVEELKEESLIKGIDTVMLRKARAYKKSLEPQRRRVRRYDPRALKPFERTW